MNKPTYNISPSLLNSLDFHLNSRGQYVQSSFESFSNSVNKIFTSNVHMERGNIFEDEVIAGEHSVFNEYLVDVDIQKWLNAVIEYEGHNFRVAGKADLIKKDCSEIYDIKRVGNYKPGQYKTSNQHLMYFLCEPKAQVFKYLVRYDLNKDTNEENGFAIETYERPKNLEKMVRRRIEKFIDFTHKHHLLATYINKHAYQGKHFEGTLTYPLG